VAARAVEKHLNTDQSDYCGPSTVCPCCSKAARYAGRRNKTFATVLDDIVLSRAYYYCDQCGHGWSPRDAQLGIEGTSLSPGVTRMVALVGASVSFTEGDELLRALAGVTLGPKMVERAAEDLGAAFAEWEKVTTDAETDRDVPPTLYMGIDGTGIPVRPSEVVGRKGKQPDGSARTRETKLCVVWSAEARDKHGFPVRDPGSVTYSAAIESAAVNDRDLPDASSDFAQRAYREACRRRFAQAPRRVVIGDGAAWIWNVAQEVLPDAIQILDRFHAKEHLHKAAAEIWGSASANREAWLDDREADLDAGNVEALIERLRVHESRCEEAKGCADYFNKHRHRMRYAQFHAAGLCTSSGIVESSCKNTVGARLKRSGMHWTVRGADAIIALRCAKLSRRLDAFLASKNSGQAAA
jgi:hypothetical protein